MKKQMSSFSAVLVLALLVAVTTVGGTAAPLVVATDAPWAPFDMVTAEGGFFGFDLDLITAIAKTSGLEIEIQNVAFDAIIESIRTGRVAIAASGLTITAQRETVVDFTIPYYLSNQAVVVTKESGVNLITAMAGMGPKGIVGAQNGSTGLWWIEDNLQAAGVDVVLNGYETYPSAILDLINGRIDAVMQDEPASQASLAAYPDALTVAGVIHTNEAFGFVVQEGDPLGLLPKMNEALGKLGLSATATPAGGVELSIAPGSFIDGLMQIYFGPSPSEIEAAWLESNAFLAAGDLDGYIDAMKAELGI